MKPKNDEQMEVVRLRGQLPVLTMEQYNWILGQDYERSADLYKGKKVETWDYYSVVTAVEDWQVTRYFIINSKTTRYGYTFGFLSEVSQRWMKLEGDDMHLHIFEKPKAMNWQWHNQPYCLDSALSLKPWNTKSNRGGRTEFFMDDCEVVPGRVFVKSFVKSGLAKAVGRIDEICLYKDRTLARRIKSMELDQSGVKELTKKCYLPTIAETLYKIGEAELAETYLTSRWISGLITRYWTSFLIARRHGLRNVDWLLWLDYVRDLERLGRDIRSPKYLCPADIGLAHGKVLDKLEAIASMEELAKNMKEIEEYEPKYKKAKQAYMGICIVTESGITISTAQSVRDIYEEGRHMHHCVFKMGYYKHQDDLILFARDKDGNRVETVRVTLSTLKIAESRGVLNKSTEWHDEIVNTLNKEMWRIGDAMRLAA